jgi:hypothetical protein
MNMDINRIVNRDMDRVTVTWTVTLNTDSDKTVTQAVKRTGNRALAGKLTVH